MLSRRRFLQSAAAVIGVTAAGIALPTTDAVAALIEPEAHRRIFASAQPAWKPVWMDPDEHSRIRWTTPYATVPDPRRSDIQHILVVLDSWPDVVRRAVPPTAYGLVWVPADSPYGRPVIHRWHRGVMDWRVAPSEGRRDG
jgi:hypothetical protein